jgi:hypothetical protein
MILHALDIVVVVVTAFCLVVTVVGGVFCLLMRLNGRISARSGDKS